MAEKLVINHKLFFPYTSFTVVVVGAGGTGSYAIPNIARIIGIFNRQFKRNDKMLIIDKDIVEEKNLARQNFVTGDVKKNKAQVLAARYSKAFGVDIAFCDEYVTNENIGQILQNLGTSCTILLGCVDNNKTRHILHSFHRRSGHSIYIDSGNEEWGGQVVFSTNVGHNEEGQSVTFNPRSYYGAITMKDIVEEYDLKADDRHPDELSCAERAMSAPQNIATNMKAADVLFGYVNKIIAGAANYLSAPDRNTRLTDEEYGKTERDRRVNFIKRVPMIGNHVVYFDAKNDQESARPFAADVQEAIKKSIRGR